MANLRKTLFDFCYGAQKILTPGLRNAQFAYKEVLESQLALGISWLDIGCGRRFLPDWMPDSEDIQMRLTAGLKSTFGIDPDVASLRDNHFIQNRVVGDSSRLPFKDNSFELLTANMVVEHVAEPRVLLSEAHRVLKPSGVFLFHTPNLLNYATMLAHLVPERCKVRLIEFLEARKAEDVFPTLYRMNTPGRVRELASSVGFRVVELRLTESSAQAVMLGPLVLLELVWIRMLRLRLLQALRSNLIVVLQKIE
jgi:SAM-dependent methyltransferase